MKHIFLSLFVVLAASVVQAGVVPVPGKAQPVTPPSPEGLVPIPESEVPSDVGVDCCCACKCRRIWVTDSTHVDPCAVPTEITVCDPFTGCNVKLTVCMPQNVQPTCDCDCNPCVQPRISRNGKRIQYGCGRYRVDIHISRRGIRVDYDH